MRTAAAMVKQLQIGDALKPNERRNGPLQICSLTRKSAPLHSACMSTSSGTPVIRLRGVRHNNLKNFDLDLPLRQPVRKDSPTQIWEMLRNTEAGMPNLELLVTFDLPLTEKLSLEESLGLITKQGYQRLLVPTGGDPLASTTMSAYELNEARTP